MALASCALQGCGDHDPHRPPNKPAPIAEELAFHQPANASRTLMVDGECLHGAARTVFRSISMGEGHESVNFDGKHIAHGTNGPA